MKQSLLNKHNRGSRKTAVLLAYVRKIAMIMVMGWLGTQGASAQDCNIVMACNDGIQVSLNENCRVDITPNLMLENQVYPDNFYEVELRRLNGALIPGNTLDGSYIGDSVEVRVTLIGCDLSCWGYITIEDKLPPVFGPCQDVTVDCEDGTSPNDIGRPSATDACSSVTYQHADTFLDFPCEFEFGKEITRRWVATDESGNTDTCYQTIYVRRARIGDVEFPPHYNDEQGQKSSLSCFANFPQLDNGAPNPNYTGFPSGLDCPNMQYHYSDLIFDICGASRKVLRQWYVIDWCTGQDSTHSQIIKILDNQAPSCPNTTPTFTIDNDPGLCSGTFDVPRPSGVRDCSDWDFTVAHKPKVDGEDPLLYLSTDGVSTDFNGNISIAGLPVGTSYVVYTLKDVCGYESKCVAEVTVEDNEGPNAVCEGYTTVSLDDIGWADIFAESLDDHSTDNCEIDRFEVRRAQLACGMPEDLDFDESVNFCCEDVANSPVKVYLRVYDIYGNYNDCAVNVTVQDKRDPVIISCPDDVTIDCGQDPFDISLTGDDIVAEDNCDVTISSRTSGTLNDCGLGSIRRIWTVTDPQGRTATCTQRIVVEDSDPFDSLDIDWPKDVVHDGCTGIDATPEALNSLPELYNTGCTDIAMSYEDDVFYDVPGVCAKILRTWRVVNWCTANPQNPDFYDYVQKIEIHNTTAPSFISGCTDQTVDPAQGSCETAVTATVQAEDDCTGTSRIDYGYEIRINNSTSNTITGSSRTFTRVLPSGRHRVIFTAEDVCGNEDSCSFWVTVTDDKAPQPICLGEVVWPVDENGTAEIWASDFNHKSTDDCSDDEDLRFAFNEAGTQTSMTFDCDDLDNGVGASIPLRMYVFDPAGNSAFCEVSLILQDNGNYCPDQGGRAAVAGNIIDASGDGIEAIEVDLMNMENASASMNETESEGDYAFDQVDYYNDYVVAPSKNDDTDNGVSTLDLVLIQRHILGIQEFNNPLQFLAADINASKTLSGADVVELRKLILGKITTFSNNESWRFVDANYEFEESDYPYDAPAKVSLGELYVDQMHVDFLGVKVGDINQSANANAQSADAESRSAGYAISTADQQYQAGDEITVEVSASQAKATLGLQLGIDYAVHLDLVGISSEAFNIGEHNMAMQDQHLALTLEAAQGLSLLDGDALITLTFRAMQDGQLSQDLSLSNTLVDAEIYGIDASTAALTLDFRTEATPAVATTLSQNTPNPFDDVTMIQYTIAEAGHVSLSFYDVNGRLLLQRRGEREAGQYSETIYKTDLKASGVIYYTLETAGQTITKKMILVD